MTAQISSKRKKPRNPIHVAIIMDGNGRWATTRGLPRIEGHRKGAEAARVTIESAVRYGIRYLTLYSFSSENWKRPAQEINELMGLLRHYLSNEISNLCKNGVRLKVIGERTDLSGDIVKLVEDSEELTKTNTRLDLIIALSYGGRSEIFNAARSLVRKSIEGDINPNCIEESMFEEYLNTSGIPDPDLLIRTGGEKRISNFLLWQIAYTEFIFLDCFWPDFGEKEFFDSISEFSRRERRYGTSD